MKPETRRLLETLRAGARDALVKNGAFPFPSFDPEIEPEKVLRALEASNTGALAWLLATAILELEEEAS